MEITIWIVKDMAKSYPLKTNSASGFDWQI